MTMKFRAHDTFFIRKGWLSKGMERVVAKNDLFIDKTENPMDILGIGANMEGIKVLVAGCRTYI